ncbi:hypothetical protein Mal15_00190 [Stieleria maiorica]|uniref:Uncharacterized protein n=1 Tax=Stieleria maiorica TaxID=2795974 RepID=A0A5B9M5T8_9BACT|nr:hypothetical protein [Stieleria maiorica]QEF95993.1 hypothetical protein Mal15_00190 [Stieleria maiorica]
MTGDQVSAADLPTPSPQRRGLRFSVLDLMLLTLLVAAWLPTVFAIRDLPELRNSVDQMRALTTHLQVIDDQKLCLRSLPGIWHNIHGWKYSLPADAEMELRLATEGIHSMGGPEDFVSFDLPTGVHTIHLQYTRSADQEFVTQVFVDDTEAIIKTHPPDWIETSSSSSNGKGGPTAEAFDLDKPLVLRQLRYMENHPGKKFGSLSLPPEYDAKGNMLSIVPKGYPSERPKQFVAPGDSPFMPSWGHRQGMRLLSKGRDWNGLLAIYPSYRAVLDDENFRPGKVLNAISVRPMQAGSSSVDLPEVAFGPDASKPDRPTLVVTDSLETTDQVNVPRSGRSEKWISEDGETMRLFAHYPAFPSGARVVVEVIFDSNFPNRMGLIPHQAEGSVPLESVQFVTQFDARFQWRTLRLLPDVNDRDSDSQQPEGPRSFALQTIRPQDQQTTGWQPIPEARLPMDHADSGSNGYRRLELTTDVTNFWTFNCPLTVSDKWQYKGLPIRQVWTIPSSDHATYDESVSPRAVMLEIQSGAVYPGTQIDIPGGPAVTNVRVTVPLPAEQPIWMEIPLP